MTPVELGLAFGKEHCDPVVSSKSLIDSATVIKLEAADVGWVKSTRSCVRARSAEWVSLFCMLLFNLQ